jgi:hypothetical protein
MVLLPLMAFFKKGSLLEINPREIGFKSYPLPSILQRLINRIRNMFARKVKLRKLNSAKNLELEKKKNWFV